MISSLVSRSSTGAAAVSSARISSLVVSASASAISCGVIGRFAWSPYTCCMRRISLSSSPPSASATAIIAFKMRSALRFAARSGICRSVRRCGADCAGPATVGQGHWEPYECGIQLASISLYDAVDASIVSLKAQSASDAAQSDPPRRYAARPLSPRRRRPRRGRAAASGRGDQARGEAEMDRADAVAAAPHQRRQLLPATHAAHGLSHRRRRASEGRPRRLRRGRDADAKYLRDALSRRAQYFLRLAVARARAREFQLGDLVLRPRPGKRAAYGGAEALGNRSRCAGATGEHASLRASKPSTTCRPADRRQCRTVPLSTTGVGATPRFLQAAVRGVGHALVDLHLAAHTKL